MSAKRFVEVSWGEGEVLEWERVVVDGVHMLRHQQFTIRRALD